MDKKSLTRSRANEILDERTDGRSPDLATLTASEPEGSGAVLFSDADIERIAQDAMSRIIRHFNQYTVLPGMPVPTVNVLADKAEPPHDVGPQSKIRRLPFLTLSPFLREINRSLPWPAVFDSLRR